MKHAIPSAAAACYYRGPIAPDRLWEFGGMARPFGEGFGSETGVILARPTARALVSGEVSRVGQGVGSEEMKRWYFSTLVFLPPLSTNSVI